VPLIPTVNYPLHTIPRVVQCGLCVHGTRARETFRQQGLWSLHIYHYEGELQYGGRRFRFLPGWASLLPPDHEATWKFPQHAPHYYAHFRVATRSRSIVRLPMLQPMGTRRERFDADIEEMLRFSSGPGSRVHVRLWDLLHRYAAPADPEPTPADLHPALQIALSLIRNNPSGRIRVGEIAGQIGFSHNQLTLLFQQHFGCGPREFIRRERVTRACDLLERSRLPVKSVAIECGFPDLQHFNKVIRTATGQSPTAWRAARHQRG